MPKAINPLHLKYRPKTFEEMIGNKTTIQALQNMVAKKRIPPSILMHGPAGTGKTTAARILARELKVHESDLNEIDSATFRGIDSIREIRRKMRSAPLGQYRVYIIDEAHKLTNDAQNASLKMLEEPPSQVRFILCTTNPEWLIEAVRSRCTSMPFKRLETRELDILLKRVIKREGLDFDERERGDIIEAADGSPRMALVILDKAAHVPKKERGEAIATGMVENPQVIDLCRILLKGKAARWRPVAEILKKIEDEHETVRLAVLGYMRQVMLGAGTASAQAAVVIDEFREAFFQSKTAGLVLACYRAIN